MKAMDAFGNGKMGSRRSLLPPHAPPGALREFNGLKLPILIGIIHCNQEAFL